MMLSHRMTASERVRARLKELAADKPHGWKKIVADKLEVAQSTVTPWFKGEQVPDLDTLERLCEITEVRLAEIVAHPSSVLRELNPDEAFIVRTLRRWPVTVRRALVAFLEFFANEEPAAGQSRKMFELWRHLDDRAKLAVYGFAVDRSEGMIPPELEAELFETLSVEAKAALEKRVRVQKRRERRNGT